MAISIRKRRQLSTVATVFFLPCICVIGGCIIAIELIRQAKNYERPKTKLRERDEKRTKVALRTMPRPLKPRLERHLTIGREIIVNKGEVKYWEEIEEETGKTMAMESEQGQKEEAVEKPKIELGRTDHQFQSLLFHLPREVRNQIWEDTLGGYVFHMYFVEAYRRMSHTRCKNHIIEICKGDADALFGPCRKNFKVPGVPDDWGQSNLLSLLQSCRRIYSEAIPMLYTKNAFDFISLKDVQKLSLTVLPERMQLIKEIQWKRTYPNGDTRWFYHNPADD